TYAAVVAVGLAGLSLLGAALGGGNASFYLAPWRGWEFIAGGMVGGLAQMWPRWRPSARLLGATAIAGLAAVIVAIIWPYLATAGPAARALLPVAGTCAIIFAGLLAPRNYVARILSLPPLVWIGLVSYSWYLWHWPALTFARLANFGDHDLLRDS